MVFITNNSGKVLVQHKAPSGVTVDYTILDSEGTTEASGSLTEVSSSGLFYAYADLSASADGVYMLYFNIDGRQAEDYEQIWKGVIV